MAKRTVPFGYRYDNGVIVIEKPASDIVKYIFEQYQARKSMLDIAEMLNRLHIEYTPGVTGWNKARIKRILEDDRYLGDEKYPVIISQSLFDSAAIIKSNRNNQKHVNREKEIYRINANIQCPCCNSLMKRRIENRTKIREHWKCCNPECRKSIAIRDDDLLSQTHGLMNRIISSPQLLNHPCETQNNSENALRQEKEISRLIDYQQIAEDVVKRMILELFTTRYSGINNTVYETERLISIFTMQKKDACSSIDLVNRTVDSITFELDNSVVLRLTNGQIIRREDSYAAS